MTAAFNMSPDAACHAAAEYCRRGDYQRGHAALLVAARTGDSAALLELGLWRVRGDVIARDLAEARSLFANAAAAGSAAAALLHAYFAASGTGGRRDWREARGMIERLAGTSSRAAEQLNLLADMALDEQGFPCGVIEHQQLRTAPDVRISRGFLNPNECDYLIRQSLSAMRPSVVVDPQSGAMVPHPVRVCDGAAFGVLAEDLVINAINRRIARLSGAPAENGEPLQILRYRSGGEYRPHLDCVPGEHNQRQCTVIIYLNDGYAGGQTSFPASNLTVQGAQGDALLFRNLTAECRIDMMSRHAGLPVTQGTKSIATRWIRQRAYDFPAPVPKLQHQPPMTIEPPVPEGARR